MSYDNCYFSHAGRFNSRGTWIHPHAVIPTWEIIYVLSGKVYIEENNIQYALSPGEILFLHPDIPHKGYQSSENVDFFWMHFRTDNGKTLPVPLDTLHDMVLQDAYYIDLLSKQLLHYAVINQYPVEACDYLIRLILMEIARQLPTMITDNFHAALAMDQWIYANLHNPITVHEIADRFGYSDDHAERLYKKAFGISMKKAINDKKMRNIKSALLTSNASLTDISTMFGFSDCKQFLKFFHYHEGISPTVFRELYYKIPFNTNSENN